MNTGLFDKNNREIKVGDTVSLVLEDGEIRNFLVEFKTVERIIKCYSDFDEEYSTVNITGIVFSWNGYDLFPCINKKGVSDVTKMIIINR